MKIQSINPSSGKLIQEFPAATKKDVVDAVKKARSAQKEWAGLSLENRIEFLRKFSQVIQDNANAILDRMNKEGGKRMPDAQGELYDSIDAIEYYIEQMKKVSSDLSNKVNPQAYPDTDFEVKYFPYGVIGLVLPWNFPFFVPMMYSIIALISGNAVVIKPSEYTTLIALDIKDYYRQAGFPDGLVEVLIGADETGKLLVKSDIDKIFFVGSIETGKDILANAGIKPVQVELGGNSAALVLKDADLNLAVNAVAWGGTYHAGQDCVGIKRVFVVESIADKFVNQLVDTVKNLRPGIDYGPFIRSEALETTKRRVDNAVSKGAKLMCGNQKITTKEGNGFWLTPSVILHANPELELVAEETFGNVLPVMIVKDEQEAIKLANDSRYGLSNAVFTKDLSRGQEIADQIQSGMVFVNDALVAMLGLDYWTGWKQSGFGTPEPKIKQFLKQKVITVNKSGQPRAFWYPYPNPE